MKNRFDRAWRGFDYWNGWGFPLGFCIKAWAYTLMVEEGN